MLISPDARKNVNPVIIIKRNGNKNAHIPVFVNFCSTLLNSFLGLQMLLVFDNTICLKSNHKFLKFGRST